MKSLSASLLILLPLMLGCGGGGLGDFGGFGDEIVPPLKDNVSRALIGGTFCCDPEASFPQEIAVLRVSNDYPDERNINVVIGPFTGGVVTEDGAQTVKTLESGDVLETKLQATRCDWETADGNLVVTTSQGFGKEFLKLTQNIHLENDCSQLLNRIRTGVVIDGLAKAYFAPQADPAPIGTDPWLYVVGRDDGVEAYAIQRNAAGKITAAPKMDASTILSIKGQDVVTVSAGAGANLTRALFVFDPVRYARSHWAGANWGGFAIGGKVTDMVSYGGESRSSGVSYANGGRALFVEYDPNINFFNGVNKSLGGPNFPDRTGSPVSVFVDEAARAALIVMDGSPGQIWFHDRKDMDAEGALIGVAGNDPRQVRAKNGLAAISNYASSTITLLAWDGATAPLPLRSFPTVANPLHIDMARLSNGNTLLAVASDTTGNWWLGELDSLGDEVRSWTGNECTGGLADIVILPGPKAHLAMACKGSIEVTLVETEVSVP